MARDRRSYKTRQGKKILMLKIYRPKHCECGCETLIIWEKELKDIELLKRKIFEFTENE